MKRLYTLFLSLAMAAFMTACTASADQRTGVAEGYGGPLRVTVSLNGTDITSVVVTEHNETEGVGTRAIDALPAAIAKADTPDVDNVSGATRTSEAIKVAVRDALGDDGMTSTEGASTAPATGTDMPQTTLLEGVGMAATGRVGPGKDAEGKQVYTFNVVFAHGSFDDEGRIQSVKVDQMEVASPNLGAGAGTFSGFPDTEDGAAAFLDEVSAWTTKGAKREGYMLGSGSWREQMNAYEQAMIGKTVDEVESWFSEKFDSDSGKPKDAQVVSGATMSLRGEHGDILTAIRRAWEDAKKQPAGEGMMVDTNTQQDGTDATQEPEQTA